MNISLDKLEELATKATQGPWHPFNGHQTFAVEKAIAGNKTTVVTWNGFDGNGLSTRQNKRNANFIAAANPDTIKSLIARVRAAESQLKAAQVQVAVGYLYPVDFEKLQNEECCVDLYSVPVGCPDGESTVKLYAAPAPADHSVDANKMVNAVTEGNQ